MLVVIYDSVFNSVFESQVLRPLLVKLSTNPPLHITLVSFEPDVLRARKTYATPPHKRMTLLFLKRLPLVSRATLWLQARQLQRALSGTLFDHTLARGPLAGWIAQHITTGKLTVQARGLCAQEHRFTHQDDKGLWRRLLTAYQVRLLERIERNMYGLAAGATTNVVFEAVSPALKQYLIDHFKTPAANIIIAQNDLLQPVATTTVQEWRAATRELLGIPADAYVYCYSGSIKLWQCFDEALDYFKQQLEPNPKSFLLVLTLDVDSAKKALVQHNITAQALCISVSNENLLHYLAAADAGFLLRKPDVINWVSRPTKALEYQAVGLTVIHNNTVQWLIT